MKQIMIVVISIVCGLVFGLLAVAGGLDLQAAFLVFAACACIAFFVQTVVGAAAALGKPL